MTTAGSRDVLLSIYKDLESCQEYEDIQVMWAMIHSSSAYPPKTCNHTRRNKRPSSYWRFCFRQTWIHVSFPFQRIGFRWIFLFSLIVDEGVWWTWRAGTSGFFSRFDLSCNFPSHGDGKCRGKIYYIFTYIFCSNCHVNIGSSVKTIMCSNLVAYFIEYTSK